MTDRDLKRLEFAKASIYKPPVLEIDESTIIHSSARIGLQGFGFARDLGGSLVKIQHAGGVRIEANVEIRGFVTIDAATNEGEFTVIGEGNKIDHHCHIAHNSKIGKHNTFANGCVVEGSCEVGSYNTFGSNVVIQRRVKVGSNCLFGSGTVVVKDIPDNSVVVGNPGRVLRMQE